jgi:hypothetical protein
MNSVTWGLFSKGSVKKYYYKYKKKQSEEAAKKDYEYLSHYYK